MPEFVPSGYFSIREALNFIGRRLFPSDWTGEEHRARSGLISQEEWLKIKDVPPARGSDAPGSGPVRPATRLAPRTPHPTGDPASAAYQQEYRASLRYAEARDRLRVLLEGGERIGPVTVVTDEARRNLPPMAPLWTRTRPCR
jgi:hypothetical protein